MHVNLSDFDQYDDNDDEASKESFNSDSMDFIKAFAEFLANAKRLTYIDIRREEFYDISYKFSENMDEIFFFKYDINTSKREIFF